MNRRRFLTLLSGATAGIWLHETGLIAAPRRFVLELSGPCSFCGKRPDAVWALAGVAQRGVRICDECVGLCFDVMGVEQPRPRPPRSDELSALLQKHSQQDDWLDAINKALASQSWTGKRHQSPLDLACSFCDTSQREVKKLVAGPNVYICDVCIADAAAITNSLQRR